MKRIMSVSHELTNTHTAVPSLKMAVSAQTRILRILLATPGFLRYMVIRRRSVSFLQPSPGWTSCKRNTPVYCGMLFSLLLCSSWSTTLVV